VSKFESLNSRFLANPVPKCRELSGRQGRKESELKLFFPVIKTYQSKSGKQSGVVAYKTGPDFIEVRFTNGNVYRYSFTSAGMKSVEEMKRLAENQLGLATYISQHNPGFE